jgi:hypothetical protein
MNIAIAMDLPCIANLLHISEPPYSAIAPAITSQLTDSANANLYGIFTSA